jgi:uncharacterized protein
MEPTVNAITLGVRDFNLAKQFYNKGLGWPIHQEQGEWLAFSLGGGSSTLGLYQWDALADDAAVAADGSGFRGFALSHYVASPQDVDEILAEAERAGGAIARPAEKAQWGGYFGYFADPDGHLWKVVATNG